MSTYTIEKLTIESRPSGANDADESVVLTESGYSSNCFDHDGRHARSSQTTTFTKNDRGSLAFYLDAQVSAHSFSSGMTKGIGMTGMDGIPAFLRNARRGRKEGLMVPLIADPLSVQWGHIPYGESEETVSPLEFMEGVMRQNLQINPKPEKSKISGPAACGYDAIKEWMEVNGLRRVQAKIRFARSPDRVRNERFLLYKGCLHRMVPRTQYRFYYGWDEISEFTLTKVIQRSQ